MKSYIFSIFVRGSVALSGFLVFIVSSKLFGAEGRGIMSYGTSIFASFGLILSFNLGRGFIVKTERLHELKRQHLFSFLVMNGFLTLLTAIGGLLFWRFSGSAQKILDLKTLSPLILLSLVYVWTVNGNTIFAAFQNTKKQEMVILGTRLSLLVFLIVFLLTGSNHFGRFLFFYSALLSFGVGCEIYLLAQAGQWPPKLQLLKEFKSTVLSSVWPHIDFLGIHLFPLLLILFSGYFLETAGIGRINFAIQITNLIFLLSSTANIRVNSYVANFGFDQKLPQIKKLFLGTLVLSILGVIMVFPCLKLLTQLESFKSFEGVEDLFAISVLALPGFLAYQFLSPLWLESDLIKTSARFNVLNSLIACGLTPILIANCGERGALYGFVIFHVGCLLNQAMLYRRHLRRRP